MSEYLTVTYNVSGEIGGKTSTITRLCGLNKVHLLSAHGAHEAPPTVQPAN